MDHCGRVDAERVSFIGVEFPAEGRYLVLSWRAEHNVGDLARIAWMVS